MKPKRTITVKGETYYHRTTYNTAFLAHYGNEGADQYYGNKSLVIKGAPIKKTLSDHLMGRPVEHAHHVYATRVTKRAHGRN